MIIKLIEHRSHEYEQMIALRREVLRKPLGLDFTAADLDSEKNDLLIGAFENKAIVGCCLLTRRDEQTVQLRQMAVQPSLQGRAIGRAILKKAEETAQDNGYTILMLHARDTAAPFYKKCGYAVTSGPFTEVGIPHYKMEKVL